MAKKPQDTTKPKKIKLVRDSFCMPKDEYTAIDVLKTRAMGLSVSVKKSELLRAGLVALSRMSDAVFHKTLAAVPTIKTGRPSADKAEPAPAPAPAPVATKPRVKAANQPAAKTPVKATAKTAAKPASAPAGTANAAVKRPTQPARKAAPVAAPAQAA